MKWQYHTEQFVTAGLGEDRAASELERVLDGLGAQSWELVSATTYHNAEAKADVLLCVFKRPVAMDLD